MRRWITIGLTAGLGLACDRPQPEPSESAESAGPRPSLAAEPEPEPEPEAEPGAAPEEPPEPTAAERAEALVSTAEALGALHNKHADACDVLAAELERFHVEHGEALAQPGAGTHAWIGQHEPLRERLGAAMERVMTVSMRCREDEAFAAVQRRLFGEREEVPAGG